MLNGWKIRRVREVVNRLNSVAEAKGVDLHGLNHGTRHGKKV